MYQPQSNEELLHNFRKIVLSPDLSTQIKIKELRTWTEGLVRQYLAPPAVGSRKFFDSITELKRKDFIDASLTRSLHGFRTLANDVTHNNTPVSYNQYLHHVTQLGEVLCHLTSMDPADLPDPTQTSGFDKSKFAADSDAEPSGEVAKEIYKDYIKAYIVSMRPEVRQVILETVGPFNGTTEHSAIMPTVFWDYNSWMTTGMLICLVEVDFRNGLLYPEYVVYEPDYLLDVTVVANAFESGPAMLPQVHLIKKWLEQKGTNGYMILGNTVNSLLDKLMNDPEFSLKDFKQNEYFASQALDLTYIKHAIPSMPREPTGEDIYKQLDFHYGRLERVVRDNFISNPDDPAIVATEKSITRAGSMLEPTFISPLFGVLGRLDLLHDRSDQMQDEDIKYHFDVVELKSGDPKGDWGVNKKDHFAQSILYHLMLKSAYGMRQTQGNVKLLYSKHTIPVRKVVFDQGPSIKEVVATRNNIAWLELSFANATTNEQVLELLNLNALRNPTLDLGYNRQRINQFIGQMEGASPMLQTYILSWIRFIYAERAIGKIGSADSEQRGGLANLWLKDRIDKIDQAEVLEHLVVKLNTLAGNKLTFSRDIAAEHAAANGKMMRTGLRQNDRVVLYPMPTTSERRLDSMSPVRNQIVKANIDQISEGEVTLSFNHAFLSHKYLESNSHWAIEKDVVDNAFDTWLYTLSQLMSVPEDRLGVLLGTLPPASSQPKPWPISGLGTDRLSDEQQRLLRNAVASPDYYLLMGPPGTGKTRFMLKNLAWYYGHHQPTNVLLMAFTNRAVDEICEQLLDLRKMLGAENFSFVRVGHNLGTGTAYREFLLSTRLKSCKKRTDVETLLNTTNVFVGTASSLQNAPSLFGLKQFDVVIVDEASQMLEPFVLGFVTKIRKFILIGDHKQLPAVVVQPEDRTAIQAPEKSKQAGDFDLHQIGLTNMRNSYFERLWTMAERNQWGHSYDMLTKQGRMHQDIGQWVSSKFYSNNLSPATDAQKEPLLPTWANQVMKFAGSATLLSPALLEALNTKRLVFIDMPTPKQLPSYSKSKESEAQLAAQLVVAKAMSLKEQGQVTFSPDQSIGVIAPFRNQVALIEQSIGNLALDMGLGQDLINNLKKVTVDTVERFQGSQRNTIVLSFTIVHPRQFASLSSFDQTGEVDRKLNVALSRAQQQLIMLGDAQVLSHNALYKDLLEYVKLNGTWVSYPIKDAIAV